MPRHSSEMEKLIRILRRKDIPQAVTTVPGQTEADHMGYTGLSEIIQRDDDQSVKVGAPFVGIFGSYKVFGKCTYCQHDVYLKPENPDIGSKMQAFCPFCRKTLYRGLDPSGEFKDRTSEMGTGGADLATNTPLPSEAKYDQSQYPSQGPSLNPGAGTY